MNKHFLKKANESRPTLRTERLTHPTTDTVLKPSESVLYDFGDHYVGYLSLKLSYVGNCPDAPAYIKLNFYEDKEEIGLDSASYGGWLSRSWIQEEFVHVDVIPSTVKLPRRYAFRYVRVELISSSIEFNLKIQRAQITALSSAERTVMPVGRSEKERRIDAVGLRTMHECMQDVFEDGPKRDRRLWLGDLRLQAQVNYLTYGQNDLVKRCLYLFASVADKKGALPGCLFTKPRVRAGNEMFSYPLLFIPTLYDYLMATADTECAEELYPLAMRQAELARGVLGQDGRTKDMKWCFVDWNEKVKETASAYAIYIYSLNEGIKLSLALGKDCEWLKAEVEEKKAIAKRCFYDKRIGLYRDEIKGDISYATNVWMILAEVSEGEEAKAVLNRLEASRRAHRPVTPYMYHHYLEALIKSGMEDKAYEVMVKYWGGMVDMGADTYRELYNPENPCESPYGSPIVNSYCHAWSCAPSYFLRKYFLK